ncbi:MAG: complex I NDUFA9 subunit family protein [Betaproteobacteria bacterium]|nr:complex I NDUFA9 subunit family protein [Betaproteobacteria bacterium]
MTPKRIVILGGGGFIGSAVAERLAAQGDPLVIPTRVLARANHLALLPTADIRQANIHDDATLHALLSGADAVINLVGILHPEGRAGFDGAHVALPRAVAKACVKQGVATLIHMSALNADVNGVSEYLRSRGRGEAAVREALHGSAVRLAVLRPSVVFGRHDNFLNMLAGLVRKFLVIPLGSPGARFQPVHVEDVADVIVQCLDQPELGDSPLELGGPRIYTMRELVDFVIATLGARRLVVPLPDALAMIQALAFEFPPGKWLGAALGVALTRDNVRSMSQPNVTALPLPAALHWRPAALEPTAVEYLQGRNHRSRLQGCRERAGR